MKSQVLGNTGTKNHQREMEDLKKRKEKTGREKKDMKTSLKRSVAEISITWEYRNHTPSKTKRKEKKRKTTKLLKNLSAVEISSTWEYEMTPSKRHG